MQTPPPPPGAKGAPVPAVELLTPGAARALWCVLHPKEMGPLTALAHTGATWQERLQLWTWQVYSEAGAEERRTDHRG